MIIHHFVFEIKDPNSIGFSHFEFIDTESIKITCVYIISRLVCGCYLKRNKNTSYERFQSTIWEVKAYYFRRPESRSVFISIFPVSLAL